MVISVIQYHKDFGWVKRIFDDEEELYDVLFLDLFGEESFHTYSADPYSDDYSNLFLEKAREAREAAEYEEREFGMFLQEAAEGGSIFNDPNHYDDDGRFHFITRSEMGYED